jgi:hypothetical protein
VTPFLKVTVDSCQAKMMIQGRLILSAPFRTQLNLNTVSALLHSEATCDLLIAAAIKAQQAVSIEFEISSIWKSQTATELHYSQLTEDSAPLSATPLFRIKFNERIIDNLVKVNNNSEVVKIRGVVECILEYYDNTIGLLYCVLDIELPGTDAQSLRVIDLWTVGYCGSVVDYAYHAELALYDSLHSLSSKYSRLGLVLRPGKDLIFLAPSGPVRRRIPAQHKLLWVTRILSNHDSLVTKEMIEYWTQQQDPEDKAIRFDNTQLSFFVGNSIFIGAPPVAAYKTIKTALSICAYYYALYDICNRNLRGIRLDLAKHSFRRRLPVKRLNHIRSQLEFLENEQIDAVLGLQGSRKLIASKILEVWEYKLLVDTVERKLRGVGRLVDYSLQEQQSHYTKLVEAILAAIGGVSLLDFSLNLLTFARNKGLSADNVNGLIDVAQSLPPDGLLYATLIILLTIFFLVVRRS